MLQFTQNNKIAVAALSIFLVSFISMLVFMDSEKPSPDFVKSDVLSSTLHEQEKGHSVYFSENDNHASEEGHSENAKSINTDALEKSYRELANQESLPIFVLEANGKTKFLSKNFIEDYGYSLDEMDDENFFSYIDGNDLPDFVASYTDVLNSGKSKNGVGPYRFKNKDGTSSIHVVSMLPVIDDNGKVTEIISSVKDITTVLKSFVVDSRVDETTVNDVADTVSD